MWHGPAAILGLFKVQTVSSRKGTSEILYLLTAKPEAFFLLSILTEHKGHLASYFSWKKDKFTKTLCFHLIEPWTEVMRFWKWSCNINNFFFFFLHCWPLGGSTTSCQHTIISSLSWHGLLVSKQFIQQTPWMCSLDLEPPFQFSPEDICGDFA